MAGGSRRGRGRARLESGAGRRPVVNNELEEEEAMRRAEEAHRNKLREVLGARKVARERGIKLPEGSEAKFFKIWKVVEELGWEEFVKEPIQPCLDIVLEFYLNLPKASGYKCEVFGKEVDYSSSAIRSLYRLPFVRDEEDGLLNLRKLYCKFSKRELMQTLTFGSPPSFTSDKTITMPITSLCDEAQFWRKFIKGRVLGITNQWDTSEDIQKTLFVMLTRRKFDVTNIIRDQLFQHKRSVTSGNVKRMSLSYPSIITALCLRAGVQIPAGSVMIKNDSPCDESSFHIDPRSIISVYAWHKHFYGERGTSGFESPVLERAEYLIPPEEERARDEDEPAAAAEPSTSQVPILALPGPEGEGPSHGQRLLNLEAKVDGVYDVLRHMQDRRQVYRQEFERDQRFWNAYFQRDPQDGGN